MSHVILPSIEPHDSVVSLAKIRDYLNGIRAICTDPVAQASLAQAYCHLGVVAERLLQAEAQVICDRERERM